MSVFVIKKVNRTFSNLKNMTFSSRLKMVRTARRRPKDSLEMGEKKLISALSEARKYYLKISET